MPDRDYALDTALDARLVVWVHIATALAGTGVGRFMEHLLNHLVQRHLIPVLLLPVVIAGMGCCGIFLIPSAFHSSSSTDRIVAVTSSLIGVLGSVVTFVLLRAIRRQAISWRMFELGRTAWIVIVTLAWLIGVGCGVLMLHDVAP